MASEWTNGYANVLIRKISDEVTHNEKYGVAKNDLDKYNKIYEAL